jgi:hypothetical protein
MQIFTSQLINHLGRDTLLKPDLRVHIARSTGSGGARIWQTGRDAESRCIEACLCGKAAQLVQQDLNVTPIRSGSTGFDLLNKVVELTEVA